MRVNPIGWVIGGFFTVGGAAFALFPQTRLLGLIWVGVSLVLFGFFAVLGGRARPPSSYGPRVCAARR